MIRATETARVYICVVPKNQNKRVKSAVYNVTVREGGGAAAAQSVSMKTPANQRTTKNVLR